jgi:hypothetical protein
MNWIQQHFDFAPMEKNRGCLVLLLQLSPGKPTGAAYWRVKYYFNVSPLTEMALYRDFRAESGSMQFAVIKNLN